MGTSATTERYLQCGPLRDIYDKVMEGKRLSFDDGLTLWRSTDLTALGALANIVRETKNGNSTYYVRNQHINYTNVCNKGCRFCSFYAQKGGPAPYTMTMDDVRAKLERTKHVPVTEIHMVAGIHPKLPYSYYLELLDTVKAVRPEAHIKAFTMVELLQIQKLAKKPMSEVLLELKAHGLSSLPGGGAEILTDRVHEELFPKKETATEWLETSKAAHRVGLHTNATMLYGHIETDEERVIHLMKLREAQDETGGFLTFIPLAFSSKGTKLSHLPTTSGYLDLKAIAIGRLMLDNFPHVKSFWIMITPPVAQIAQWYGADDIDGTIVEYEITHEIDNENSRQNLSQRQMVQMIVEAGRDPVERDPLYNVIEREDSRTLLPERPKLSLPMADDIKGPFVMQRLKEEPAWYQRTWFVMLRGLVTAQSVAGFLMLCARWIGAGISGSYGWAFTLIIPLIIGAVSAYCWRELNFKGRATLFWLSCLNTLLSLVLASLFLHEGVICLVMAAPLLITMVTVATYITTNILQAKSDVARVSLAPVLFVMLVTGFFSRTDWQTSATTEMRVNAPPSMVYPYIVAFPQIAQPSDFWLCRLGLPYPVGTTADGTFVGAKRSCRFSGDLAIEERISSLIPNREVDFDIVDQMHYPEIADHAKLARGRIAIHDNGDGTSTLVGTSWYTLRVAPAAYFSLWSDYLIHQGHTRVFTQIKALAEAANHSRSVSP